MMRRVARTAAKAACCDDTSRDISLGAWPLLNTPLHFLSSSAQLVSPSVPVTTHVLHAEVIPKAAEKREGLVSGGTLLQRRSQRLTHLLQRFIVG